MIKYFVSEYARYRSIGEKAIGQVPDEALNRVASEDNNSIAIVVRHIGGNFVSRFTDFLATDGEKEWRDRDSEFADAIYGRPEVDEIWAKGWGVLESTLAGLEDADLEKTVYIRGHALTVYEALLRSLAHVAYHVGQIVLLARIVTGRDWDWISIPKGQSSEYNKNPTKERKLG